MDAYAQSLAIVQELFAKDSTMALATAKDNKPSVRIVDVFYDEGAFYIVTHNSLQKVVELEANPCVALCHDMFRFTGSAKNIGHPLKEENATIRAKLVEVFAPWYFAHNDENDAGMCIVRVALETGFIQHNKTGYKIDFAGKSAERFPFDFGPME